MITRAIIAKLPEEGSNKYLVEIPLFEDNTNTSAYMEAMLCNQSHEYELYDINDVVYIGFEGETLNYPVILGKMYTSKPTDEERKKYEYKFPHHIVSNLEVTGVAKLPRDTMIGEYGVEDFFKLYNKMSDSSISAIDYIIPTEG